MSARVVAGRIALYAVLLLALIPVLFPVYYVFAGTFMQPRELATFPPQLVPTGFHLENIQRVLDAVERSAADRSTWTEIPTDHAQETD